MEDPNNDPLRNPEVLEIVESILDMCISREKQICELNTKIEAFEKLTRIHKEQTDPETKKDVETHRVENGILMVEDSAYLKHQLEGLLVENGYEIVGSTNDGHEAIQLVTEEQPALVTIDSNLRSAEGLKITSLIKRIDPNIKVLIINPDEDKFHILQAAKYGADDCIARPVSPKRLIQIIDRLLGKTEKDDGKKKAAS